jgi:quinoprotein relay system zinc metallohydrolase 1
MQRRCAASPGRCIRWARGAINTHHHPDHFLGNQIFTDLPIRARGQTAALASLHREAYADNLHQLPGDWMRGAEPLPPNRVLTPGRTRTMGREFDILPLGGQTEADLALLDVQTGRLIAEALAFLDRAPTTPSADIGRWQASIDTLSGIDGRGVIPGHGPFDTTVAPLHQTRAYLDLLSRTMADAARLGFDMLETMQRPLPPDVAALGAQPQECRRSVAHLFPAAERAALPQAN